MPEPEMTPFSPKAEAICRRIKDLIPLDPWGREMMSDDWVLEDNGKYDLKTSRDRARYIRRLHNTISYMVYVQATAWRDRNPGRPLNEFTVRIDSLAHSIELVLLLEDLVSQVEVIDAYSSEP